MRNAAVVLVPLGLLIAMMLCHVIGRRIGERARDLDGVTRPGVEHAETAASILVSLLLAFMVTSAATRLDTRRHLIVDETNAIGTAYLRIDLVPPALRPPLKQQFRAYVDSRLAAFRLLPNVAAATAENARGEALLRDIWTMTVAAADETSLPKTYLLVPAVNQMIDLSNSRNFASKMHPSVVMFAMLGIVLLVSSVFSGYAWAGTKRSWIHITGIMVLHTLVFWVILDLEYPRVGFLHETAFDQALVEVRAGMR